MKKQVFQEHSRLGFTLVELLVVISIIGMLAGLLLPAVNAAREAGRRAVCMNNQSQLALALLNYDSAKGNLPPMRGEVGSKIISVTETNYNITSWLGFLMPYMEQVPLYQNLTEVRINATSGDLLYHERQLTRIKSLICPSADVPLVDAGTHYVCNAGYQNATATTWLTTTPTTIAATPGWATRPFDPGKIADAVFFDHRAGTNTQTTGGPAYDCKVKCSVDYISSHDGTGNVVLLSENERVVDANSGARWSRWNGTADDNGNTCMVDADGEDRIAFCYPMNLNYDTVAKAAAVSGSLAETGTDAAKISYQSYNTTPLTTTTDAGYHVPAFINQGRGETLAGFSQYRRARPSSNHPGIVLAAFADRSVRPVNENMDKRTFVWLCQPNSGQVISGDAF